MTAELTVKNTHIFYPKLVKVYADLARKSIRLLTPLYLWERGWGEGYPISSKFW